MAITQKDIEKALEIMKSGPQPHNPFRYAHIMPDGTVKFSCGCGCNRVKPDGE